MEGFSIIGAKGFRQDESALQGGMERKNMRLDKYLKVSRIIKRRTVANEACDSGRVMLNDKVARASAEDEMPRNIERDEKEAMRRKEQLMEAGFRLFSQYGIENVSLQRVADAAEVGVATLYNYYQTKVKLVIAISGKIWGDLWKEILEEKGPEIFESFTAYQYIEFYTDQIIRIYRERPEILRFSNNYKNFISREKVRGEALAEHLDVLKPAGALYHKFYEQARSDKSIRTDIPEQQLFTSVAIAMLAVAERYAQGIVWADDHKEDHTQELEFLKGMLLTWCRTPENLGKQ